MKRFCAVWFILFSVVGYGQHTIPSYSLSVTLTKTTNIIFPYRIEKADIGSADVIGHKDQILGNVLFLKAGRKNFTPTNLSVYTSDGKFYSFLISYREELDTLNLSFIPETGSSIPTVDSFMEYRMDSAAANILTQPSFIHRKVKTENMKVILTGIYLADNLLWFRFKVKNHSEIEYKPTFVRFSIKDKKAGKRMAIQENDCEFVWSNYTHSVSGKSREIYLFAFPVFTVPKKKKLIFQMQEKMGERSLSLDITSHEMLKSRSAQ